MLDQSRTRNIISFSPSSHIVCYKYTLTRVYSSRSTICGAEEHLPAPSTATAANHLRSEFPRPVSSPPIVKPPPLAGIVPAEHHARNSTPLTVFPTNLSLLFKVVQTPLPPQTPSPNPGGRRKLCRPTCSNRFSLPRLASYAMSCNHPSCHP